MTNRPFRKALSAPGLLKTARQCFDQVENDVTSRGIHLTDCLMSGLAIFGLKYPSLLQFDKNRNEKLIKANLQTLYGVEQAPSDTNAASLRGYSYKYQWLIWPSRFLTKAKTLCL